MPEIWTYTIFICALSLQAADCHKGTADRAIEVLASDNIRDCFIHGAKLLPLVDMSSTTGKQVVMRCVLTWPDNHKA